jgi:serine/threonine protein kinase
MKDEGGAVKPPLHLSPFRLYHSEVMDCPNCQQPLREGAQFCTRCGARTSQADGAAAPTSGGASQPTVVGVHIEPDAPDPFIGRVLEGKYEIVAPLGAGGMGAVYLARRVLIGDEVAVKVLHSKFTNDEKLVERFRREARAAAQLHHPNVVTIHDYGEPRGPGGFAYIVMEFVRGESLRQLLRREGRLDARRAVELMRGVCAGVGAAHRRDIVHRDIKPDNVIVSPADDDHAAEQVKVVDFGIAKIRDMASESTLTEAGSMVGTLFYMAPEQCKGEPLDARADVYSLGAMLYEMLAGSPPFNAPSITSIILKHVNAPPPPLPEDAHVPVALAAAVMRALAKDPDDRPRDATEFAREIQAALAAPDAHASAGPVVSSNQPAASSNQSAADSAQSAAGSTQSAEPFFPATARPVPVTPTNPLPTQPPTHSASSSLTPTPTLAETEREEVTVVRDPSVPHPQRQNAHAPAQRTDGYAQQPAPPHSYAPAPPTAPARRSRKGYVLGLLFVLLVVMGGLTVVGVLLYMNRGGGTTVNVNTRPTPTPPRGNTNASPTPTPLPEAMQLAEVKIIGGSLVSPSDLSGLTPPQLNRLRNTVYARYGRTFQDNDLRLYFQSRPWYKPRADYDDDKLTTNDRANAELIKAFEDNGGAPPRADAARVNKEVKDALEDWADSTSGRDLDDHMSHYADTLETYYKRQNVPASQVRTDRNNAFVRYDDMKVKLDNFQVTPDPTGLRATVTFDKTWEFDSPDKNSKGSVRQQLTLLRAGGRWLINGERDLQVYYSNSEDYTQ